MLAAGILAILVAWLARPSASVAIEATVSISNYAYRPPTITIAAGQTITWSQDDVEQHTVTACTAATCPTVSSLSFDSGILTQGQIFRLTFAAPGTYPYYCTVHTYALMHGTVVVTPLPPSAATASLPTGIAATPRPSPTPTAATPTVAIPAVATPAAATSTVATSSQAASSSPGSAVLGPPSATATEGSRVTGPPSGTAKSGSAAIFVALIALGLGVLVTAVGLRSQRGGAGKD